ncbi:MAG: hypothetical protein KU38_08825 [Sulfurovum sp. FS08-3]|nr:MAG: hypothetical protein KU38_08825 [Sulfurovum sp. FS08-3]
MFVGWIRKNSFREDLERFSLEVAIDKGVVLNCFDHGSLIFGAYEGETLIAFVVLYEMENLYLLNGFYYKPDTSNPIKERLLKILFNNLYDEERSVVTIVHKSQMEIFTQVGFKALHRFTQATYSGGGVAFNFTNAMAKSITRENYIPTLAQLNKRALGDDMVEYITQNIFKSSSLILSTDFGYQHSYALDKSTIKISPWIMEDGAFDDAHKLIRGVIYHRGLKKISAFIPADAQSVVELYQSYQFVLEGEYYLMYKNTQPSIDIEMIYGL